MLHIVTMERNRTHTHTQPCMFWYFNFGFVNYYIVCILFWFHFLFSFWFFFPPHSWEWIPSGCATEHIGNLGFMLFIIISCATPFTATLSFGFVFVSCATLHTNSSQFFPFSSGFVKMNMNKWKYLLHEETGQQILCIIFIYFDSKRYPTSFLCFFPRFVVLFAIHSDKMEKKK